MQRLNPHAGWGMYEAAYLHIALRPIPCWPFQTAWHYLAGGGVKVVSGKWLTAAQIEHLSSGETPVVKRQI